MLINSLSNPSTQILSVICSQKKRKDEFDLLLVKEKHLIDIVIMLA